MGQVLNGLADLQQVSTNYAGGQGGDIKSGIETTLTTVKSATGVCAKMGPVTMDEAAGFRPTAEKLVGSGDKLVVTLTSKVPLFEKNHICGPVLGWFGGLGTPTPMLTPSSSHRIRKCLTNPQPFLSETGENVGVLMQTVATKFPTNSSANEIAAFKAKFGVLGDKLKACSGNMTEPTSAKPAGAQVTNPVDAVSHSGAGTMGVSAGALALAAAAAILL
ncbi:hypothetical protein PG994_000513 [Apiospora phragmitis]|uniref:Uncharacterized protein n=1 Tax=Apiospora phragmitis TaxID=2905665 RepID=A0ABR1X6I8_9PEZI